ncbi:hypothetical protein SKAU_G00382560 [Synaphobranchus kaupii]|uniref:C-type lectin domain-containing protein n=1 Tax=Synaphobranchus kaupii TaxID=118154 RepID=A0A9Q1IEW6_SYNKA|nr:hypothetical protein SKAU_G00382560 [Synaphobranchus kaupii]
MASFTLSAFLCVAVLSSITLAIPFPGPCPKEWEKHKGYCYQYVSQARSWIDAELHCLSLGGNLASQHSQEDHFFLLVLQMYSGAKGPFWIGLSDVHKEGAWLWSDGSRVDFTVWNFGEPNSSGGNEDCVHSNFGDGDWNDSLCHRKYPFVCSLRPY